MFQWHAKILYTAVHKHVQKNQDNLLLFGSFTSAKNHSGLNSPNKAKAGLSSNFLNNAITSAITFKRTNIL
jgi:hypothetical protein